MPENKSRYTEAQKRAAEKYLKESVEEFKVRVPKGTKERYKNHAMSRGESLNSFVIRAIESIIDIDNNKP